MGEAQRHKIGSCPYLLIYEHKNSDSDFRSVFIKSYEIAKKSLKETPKKLKVLAKADVAD